MCKSNCLDNLIILSCVNDSCDNITPFIINYRNKKIKKGLINVKVFFEMKMIGITSVHLVSWSFNNWFWEIMILESLNLNCKAFDKTRSKASKLCMLDDNSTILYLKKKYKNFHMQHIFSMHMCVQKKSWSTLVLKKKIKLQIFLFKMCIGILTFKIKRLHFWTNHLEQYKICYSNYKYPCLQNQVW